MKRTYPSKIRNGDRRKIFFIADTHFGHANMIRLCHRPYASVEEMDEDMMRRWNAVVGTADDVYILGDFSYRGADPCTYLDRLNGRKHLIIGNHDRKPLDSPEFRRRFVEIKDVKTLVCGGKRIVLFHYPMAEWDGMYRGSIHFFGHIHNNNGESTWKIMSGIQGAYNVGADVIGFTPRTLEEILSGYDAWTSGKEAAGKKAKA